MRIGPRLIAIVLIVAVAAPAFAVAGPCCAKAQAAAAPPALATHNGCAHHGSQTAIRSHACHSPSMPCTISAKPLPEAVVQVAFSSSHGAAISETHCFIASTAPRHEELRLTTALPRSTPLRI